MAKSQIDSPMSGGKGRPDLNIPAGVSGRNPMVEHGDVPQTPTSVGIKFPTTVDIRYGGNDPKLNTPMGKGIAFRKPPKDQQIPKVPHKA